MKSSLVICSAVLAIMVAASAPGQEKAGIAPVDASHCPADHPIKGYASKQSDGAGVFYAPDSSVYGKAKAERCFATEAEARSAGYRAGREEKSPSGERGKSSKRP
jgi:hypothetical protein